MKKSYILFLILSFISVIAVAQPPDPGDGGEGGDGGTTGNGNSASIQGPGSVCRNESISYVGSGASSYYWTVEGGYIDGPADQSSVSVVFSTMGTTGRVWLNENGTNSASKIVTVFSAVLPGSITNNVTYACEGEAVVGEISDNGRASGGGGSYTYYWQKKVNGQWENITGEHGFSYQPGVLTSSTTYRRQVVDGHCLQEANSNEIVITVTPESLGGTLNGARDFFGVGTGSITLAGDQRGVVTEWQVSDNGINGWTNTDNNSSNISRLNYSNLLATKYYRAIVKNNDCQVDHSDPVKIEIHSNPTLTYSQEELRPGTTATLSIDSGYDTYQWYKEGASISGATSHTLNVDEPGNYSVSIGSNMGAQTTGEFELLSQLEGFNSVTTYTARTAGQTESSIKHHASSTQDRSINVTYSDGLGRSIQMVSFGASPLENDVIKPVEYVDGIQTKDYLAYTSTDKTSINQARALDKDTPENGDQSIYYQSRYGTNYSYSEQKLESSPLKRPVEIGSPGDDWKLGMRSVRIAYESSGGSVYRWTYDNKLSRDGTYPSGSLYRKTTTDEDGHVTREFTNGKGQIIRRSSKVGGSTWAHTDYVYDVHDRLCVVLPPEAVNRVVSDYDGKTESEQSQFLDNWAFQYAYDNKGRMISKMVPGSDEVLMVYDKWNRLVLTQDGNQRAAGQWLFTKYDHLNRPVMSGLVDDYPGIEADVKSESRSDASRYELFTGSGETQYSYDRSEPQGTPTYHTITYYDNYSFTALGFTPEFDQPEDSGPYHLEPDPQTSVKGQVTGTKTKILGTDDYLETITYYDDRYRVIQVKSENHLGGMDVISNQYDFVGNVRRVHSTHSDGSTVINQLLEYDYDHANRLISCDHSLNGSTPVRLYVNQYNELGELINKNMHEGTPGAYSQVLDYEYNIRGWLESINGSGFEESDPMALFNMDLIYHTELELSNN